MAKFELRDVAENITRKECAIVIAAVSFGSFYILNSMFKKKAPVVNTLSGRIQGRWCGSTAVFEGIPFAQPPLVDLRWKPPQPVDDWKGIRKADSFKPYAKEEGLCLPLILKLLADGYGFNIFYRTLIKLSLPFMPKPRQSEDCLYLNIRSRNIDPTAKQPVMVWIHGGNYVDGGSSDQILIATERLMKEGVVVVTISYRLGIFGFLAHPDLLKESQDNICGNYGLLDQIAALTWVSQNIMSFGGDPDNLTLFGYSAGGDSVAHLMTCPKARGLFHKAILQSPGSSCPMLHLFHPFMAYPKALDIGQQFADQLFPSQKDQIQKLRKVPADELHWILCEKEFNDSFLPAIDGHIIPKSPFEAFADGEQAKVPFIIGSTANEGTVLYPYFGVPMVEYFKVKSTDTSGIFPFMEKAFSGADLLKLESLYPGLQKRNKKAEMEFFGDHTFGSSALFYAECAQENGQKVFLYSFNRMPPSSTQTLGAFHGSENFFIFGNLPPVLFPFGFTKQELALSNSMIKYWTQFARTGDPNGQNLPEWASFDKEDPQFNVLHTTGTGMQRIEVFRKEKYEIMNALRRERIQAARMVRLANM